MNPQQIHDIKERVLAGGEISSQEALSLADITPESRQALREAASEITARFSPRRFDSCSIISARSGRCPEDCKWCAQSAHYRTTIGSLQRRHIGLAGRLSVPLLGFRCGVPLPSLRSL